MCIIPPLSFPLHPLFHCGILQDISQQEAGGEPGQEEAGQPDEGV